MSDVAIVCIHCQKPMNVPTTFTGRFAEFRCKTCGKTFGATPSALQERVLGKGAEAVKVRIEQRMIDIAQEIIGLPITFHPVKEVKYAVMRRVKVVSPKNTYIDIGAITFTDDGKICNFDDCEILTMILDRLDPKDRF